MKILVTGGMGFIGSNFILHIAAHRANADIINADNLSYGSNPENLRGLQSPNYRFVKVDIAHPTQIIPLVEEADMIVNFAAHSHVDRSIANPKPFHHSNVQGPINLLETMRKRSPDTLLLQMSTDEVYGDNPKGSCKEMDPLKPSSPYSASKAAADLYIQAYTRTYNLETIIARSTNNYGPRQFPEKLIPKTIIRALKRMKIPIYGSGLQVRDWIYVEDVCKALTHILERGKPGETYNISSGQELANIDLVTKILSIMDKPKELIKHIEDRPGHDKRYSLNSTKLRSLGWKPRHNLEETLTETVKWYIENEEWWKPLATKRTLHTTPWKA